MKIIARRKGDMIAKRKVNIIAGRKRDMTEREKDS